MDTFEMEQYLVEMVGISQETVDVVSNINGWNEKTMCDILYATTGYRDFEQIKKAEGE